MVNPIEQELAKFSGPVGQMAQKYTIESSQLLGLLLKLDFEDSQLVTCDPWKHNCGGLPRGSFILFRIDPRSISEDDSSVTERLILARITNSAPTPVESNVQQTLFQVHKLQAQLDPLTQMDLQWSALRASIVGTFYDENDEIKFGNDIDTFLSPFAYIAYVPTAADLATLINSFVRCEAPVQIGDLRYTETPATKSSEQIPILIDPQDLVGEPNAAQRLANFGKTRFGKSNSNKIIANSIFKSGIDAAQVFFDPSGEYTYINDQDKTSLFALHHEKSRRYSLAPKELRPDEIALGLTPPQLLSVNFYEYCSVGHELIVSLWSTENSTTPGYMRPILDWAPSDLSEAPASSQKSEYNHYWRTMGMWWALLYKAGYPPENSLRAPIDFRKNVKTELSKINGVRLQEDGTFHTGGQPLAVLPAIYERVAQLHKEHDAQKDWFDRSSDGAPYFNDIEEKLLRVLSDKTVIAHNYIRPFNKYHSSSGISVFQAIAADVSNGLSVFIDMSQSNETVRNNLVDRICRSIFNEQNRLFNSANGVGSKFVVLYFEEAHRLFSKDDNDMNSIYNLLAKEGAKLNIGMIYSTQSMTTISPDLLKNTDNFLIAHLDDDRETREVARKYAFRDVADDVQRIQSKGFVRMITKSHRFALPVQIKLFSADSA